MTQVIKVCELNFQICASGMFLSLRRKFFLASWLTVYCGIRFLYRQPLLIFCKVGTLNVLHTAKILLKKFVLSILHVQECTYVCIMGVQCPQRLEDGVGSPRPGVTEGCYEGAKNGPKSSAESVPSCWAISPTSCLPSKERSRWSWL